MRNPDHHVSPVQLLESTIGKPGGDLPVLIANTERLELVHGRARYPSAPRLARARRYERTIAAPHDTSAAAPRSDGPGRSRYVSSIPTKEPAMLTNSKAFSS